VEGGRPSKPAASGGAGLLGRAATTLWIVAASLGALAGALAGGAVEEPVYLPGGVCDVGGEVGCLRTPEGGVEAVDLETGRSLWSSAAPARALVIARGRAFVLEAPPDGPLRVAAYETHSGRLARSYELATLTLPAWASPAEPRDGRQWTQFVATARVAGDMLELRYDATRMQVSGMQPPGPVARAQGLVLLDLGSGRIESRPGPGPAPPPLSEPAPPSSGARWVSCHARRPGPGLVLAGPPPNVDGAQIVGEQRLAFELSPDTRSVIVRRWSASGRRRETPLRLEHGHATDAVWMTSDRRHVLLRRAYEQEWYDLYSLASGALVGSLKRPADVAVVDRRVYFTTAGDDGGLVVAATETGSGRMLWRRTLLEPEGEPGEPIP